MNIRKIFIAALLLFIIAFTAPAIMAQSLVSGDITGTITDQSGAVIPNATVNLKSLDTGATQTATSNQSGYYRFSLLKPGRYTVTVDVKGFQKMERPVAVNVGQAVAANFTLTLGQATETLEVTSEVPLVNTDNANVASAYDLREVQSIPNPGGDITNIAQLAPGVTMNTSAGYGNFTANGLPATSNLFTINGENNMDPFFNINNTGATNLTLGQNEVQEATVVTNAYSGQYGQQAGAQVNYVTKSGSNAYHGSAKWLWNGRAMNANDWFNKQSGNDRPFSNNNQWGADFGGPLVKNKTFFYVNNEGLRYVLPTVQDTYIPSQAFINASLGYLQANASSTALQTYQNLYKVWGNPAVPGAANAADVAGSCGDIINEDGTSNLVGLNADSACIRKFSSTPGQLSSEWILSARVDHHFSDKDQTFVRYQMDRGLQATNTDPINPNYNSTSSQPSYDGQLQWTHVFTGNTTNQFISSVKWYTAIFDQPNIAKMMEQGIGYDFVFQQNAAQLSRFGFSGTYPQGRNVTQYQFIDDFSHIRGNHSLKFGVNFRRYDVSDFNFFFQRNPRLYFFSMLGLATDNVDRWRQGFPNEGTGAPIAMYGLGLYGQDEWRVNNRLKLTLALRAEHNSNPVCQSNCFNELAGPFESLAHGRTVAYNQRIETGLHQAYRATDKINFSPRFGFTYAPFANEKTVISGGIGIFYDALPQGIMEDAFQSSPGYNEFNVYNYKLDSGALSWADPNSAYGGLTVATASNTALVNGFKNGASYNDLRAATGNIFAAPSFTNFAGTMHTPQYQEWNLQIQQALTNNMSLTVNYFGTHGIYVPVANGTLNAYDAGYCGYEGANCGAGFAASALDPSFATITEWRTAARSNSNGLSFTFARRFARGLSLQANYTWSHTLDEVSNGGAFMYGGDSLMGQLNPKCLSCNNYGNADNDIRHNFNASFVYELPFKGESAFTKNVLGGWTLSGTIFGRTGLPYTVLDANSYFPNLGGALFIPGQQAAAGATGACENGSSLCFDPAKFVNAVDSSFDGGTVYSSFPTQRRNQFRGPGLFDVNFTVQKNFHLSDRFTYSVGANFYNLFNHPNFYLPNMYLADGDPTVGTITSTVSAPSSPYGSFVGAAASPRLVQLQMKLNF